MTTAAKAQRSSDGDEDDEAVRHGLRAALASSGLSQAGFARALGTSPSRFSTYLNGRSMPGAGLYLRALRVGAGLRAAAEGHWMSPIVTTTIVARALRGEDEAWALRMILQARDHARTLLRHGAAGSWEAVPGSTGSAAWDRLLAALIAHEYELAGHLPPGWTRAGPADEPLVFRSPYFDDDEVRRRTPPWLAERNIYLPERDLATA